ncbi:MAG TPA: PIN domain-containing protein [Longimicrobiaceae bacterium]|nr:PIN domain-containing protein [Longimicrobiaceae bacterium]
MAVLDANVLFPQFLRDLLLRLAAAELFAPRWSDRIQSEWSRNLAAIRPDIPAERIARLRDLMESAFPAARVTGHRALEREFSLVDAKDRHVAAAALRAGASVIVTHNLRHFPAAELASHGIRAIDPDAFVLSLVARDRETVTTTLEQHRLALTRPPYSPDEYRAAFTAAGLARTATRLFR